MDKSYPRASNTKMRTLPRKLFDDRSTGICLLVQDDRLKVKLLQESGDRLFHAVVVTMHNKDLARLLVRFV